MSVYTIEHGRAGYHVALITILHVDGAYQWRATVRNDGYVDEDCPRFLTVREGVEDVYALAEEKARAAFRVNVEEGGES